MSKLYFEDKFSINIDNINVNDILKNFDGGELFLEDTSSEVISVNNGIVKTAHLNNISGASFRCFEGDKTSFAASSEISEQSIKHLLNCNTSFLEQKNISIGNCNPEKKLDLYPDTVNMDVIEKISLLQNIYEYIKTNALNAVDITVTIAESIQNIGIINIYSTLFDVRPMVRFSVNIVGKKHNSTDTGVSGFGGRYDTDYIKSNWKFFADKAINQLNQNLEAKFAPSGEYPVVLGNGWAGVILHEAIGHGLEADFNRKGTSVFTNRIGEKVASSSVTIVDDGTIPNKRGSLNFDDEGTVTTKNVLVENGILKNYMYDNMNANLMGKKSTGNGRRESYKYTCIPRMTNTFMLSGEYDENELISTVDKGIYAVNFSGGQVDITSGKFTFSVQEGYLIENGKVTTPIRGVTLIGDGEKVLSNISMVANNMELDPGVGTCGKDGQSVPVSVGQPSIKIDKITVGGM